MSQWKRWISGILTVVMISVSCPAPVQAAAVDDAESQIDVSENQNDDKQFAVGENVTATYDAETGTVTLHSHGGTLWAGWLDKLCGEENAVKREEIQYIRVSEDSDTIYLPENSSNLFSGCSGLKEVNLSIFASSNVTNMREMFSGCSSLSNLDVSNFDTSNVTNMREMFSDCSRLSNLDVSSFDTSSVTDMSKMFYNCKSLTNLDLNSFDTSSVTDMGGMFRYCNSLTDLDLSSFDTSNVTSMEWMISGCGSLSSLDLSSFDLSSLDINTEYAQAYGFYPFLIDSFFSHKAPIILKTPKVNIWENVYFEFILYDESGKKYSCLPVQSESILLTDTRKEIHFREEREGDIRFETGDDVIGTYNEETRTITLFSNGGTLRWDSNTFYERYGVPLWEVEYIRVSEDSGTIYFPKCSDNLFTGCSKLKEVDLSRFDASNVTSLSFMFAECESLESVDVSGFDSDKISFLDGVFWDCKSLESLDLSSWKLLTYEGTETSARDCFKGCDNLTTIKTPQINTWDSIELPHVMYDDDDNGYSSLPKMNESITLSLKAHDYGDIVVGDGVTATFDNLTGEVVLHSDGGVLWPKWIDKLNVYEDIKSIRISESSGTVYMPADASYLFSGCPALTNLDLSGFDTSKVTDMSNMFSGCKHLTNLDLSGFDTSNVTNMSSMFSYCENVTSLDLSGFDTSNVTDMSKMFYVCINLTNLDVGSFDTSNVTNMQEMFGGEIYGCENLTNLDLSGFDTSKVTNMGGMFDCGKLLNLDLSGFDTSNVTDMSSMFSGCNSLTNLDVSSFDTSNVTDMGWMFSGCSGLTNLDLSSFDTSNVTDMSNMFSGCSSLSNLDVSNFDTSNVTNMREMFSDCSRLSDLDVSSFDTSNVTDMSNMFSGCSSLSNLDVSNFDTSNVTNMREMFSDCSRLSDLDVSSFDTPNVTDMGGMFSYCSGLTNLDLSNFDTSNVTDMSKMFYDCSSLINLDLSSFDLSSIDMSQWTGATSYDDDYYDLLYDSFGHGSEALTILKTPKGNPLIHVTLPHEMYDELGNKYQYLPHRLSDSILLASSQELAEEMSVPASGIVLDRTEAVIKRGESIKLTASVFPDTASFKAVNWTSSDESIAVVNTDGLVTAFNEGTADITARTVTGDSSACCQVTVGTQEITGVSISRSTLTLKRGEVSTLTAAVESSYAENKSVTWSSSDESVASVDENGTITTLKIGSTDITVTTVEGGFTAVCKLTVVAPDISGIAIDVEEATVSIGKTLQITATVEPEDAANQKISWYPTDGSVATVSDTGLVTAIKEGITFIVASTAEGGFTTSCKITVKKNTDFTDVADPSAWYYDSVYWAVENGVTSGMGEGTFQPTTKLSRAQAVTFLYNFAGKPDVSGLETRDFSDVSESAWYYNAVKWAVANKITSGYGTGTFQPNATCTRAMIVTFLMNYAKAFGIYKEPSTFSNFKDVASDAWYKASVDWAVENGITSGYGQGTFQPNAICNRAMMVVFLKKLAALSEAA